MEKYFSQHKTMIGAGLFVTAFCIWLLLAPQDWVRTAVNRLDYLTYDLRLQAMHEPSSQQELDVVIIDIDEASLKAQGRWPWSRVKIADLVVRLNQFGAKTIGFDMAFPEPERNAASELLISQSTLQADEDKKAWLSELVPQMDRDRLLAENLPGRNVVLGVFFSSDSEEAVGALPRPWFFLNEEQQERSRLIHMLGYSSSLAILQNLAEGGGYLNSTPDDDGVMRRSPLAMRYEDRVYPSLALAMAQVHSDTVSFKVEHAPVGGKLAVQAFRLDKVPIRTDALGRVLIHYYGKRHTFEYVSANDVLTATRLDQLPQLKDKAVIVGTSALGLYDVRSTPLAPAFPGVEIQASILQTLLDDPQGFPLEPAWEDAGLLFLLLGIGLLLTFVAPVLSAGWLSLLGAGFILPIVGGNLWLWQQGIAISPVLPLLLVILIVVVNIAWGFFSESALRGEMHDMFGQYVPAAHIDKMLDDPDAISFAGETKQMSVLFADIRNFTTISESLEANQLKEMLNDFFTPITGIIFDSQGTIDKYIGDLVMAFWGAPLDDAEHREHAIGAALDMLKKVDEIRPEFVKRGFPEIYIGVGINSGPMNVGDMGSEYRRSYTVLGDAVNLGSRLEGLTKFYGVSLLVGEQTRDGNDGYLYRYIDKVMVKGKDEPIRIYEPVCRMSEATPEQIEDAQRHERGMYHYMAQEWDKAEHTFSQFEDVQSKLMVERMSKLREQVLGPEWDGAFRHLVK